MTSRRTAPPPLAAALLLLAPAAFAQRGAAERSVHEDLASAGIELPPARRVSRGELRRADLKAGAADRPAILLTGYWPPSNEAIRHFSPDPVQNPGGWQGANWEGRGYDVYAFFPEFVPPDCASCGQGSGDLEVDYQDTSADFWPIADGVAPIAILTFSRGSVGKSWEVELNQYNKTQWASDYTSPVKPTPTPPNAAAPPDSLIQSSLPVEAIATAVDLSPADANGLICVTGDGGGFLSEFIAYHGVWYRELHADPADPAWCAAAGHIHIGTQVSWDDARIAAEASLRTVMQYVDDLVGSVTCQADVGFGGPGDSTLVACGDELSSGNSFYLSFEGAPPNSLLYLCVSSSFSPLPLFQGLLTPVPIQTLKTFPASELGGLDLYGLPGGGGPITLYAQVAYIDFSLPGGLGFSNTVAMDFLP